ncbi:nucleotide exchange factor GrpE [Paracrocinitomix mangrovi]|uniref:nucleotide exchange factor GrpE n=1 Tax=Paracrocinitomix mangrovi TaxID=2862509 RepID=UPI001EDC4928|nr:nucleotide exchange factor GrpE [Paracrocinitomix mangrovi]UKN03265.1 nucleotide exchange factor GrpE [Paracrocinitomix mangrovi]
MARKKDKTDEIDEQENVNAQEEHTQNSDENSEQSENKSDNSLEAQYKELNDKYLRLYSDFDNFRKRTIKEKADIIGSASGDVIKELLEVLDDFERAIANNENISDPEALREGFKLIQHKLKHKLEAKGLEPMEAKGDVFDADKHEAITQIPVSDDMKGKVVDVIERGYNLKGHVLRYAKVVVGQ